MCSGSADKAEWEHGESKSLLGEREEGIMQWFVVNFARSLRREVNRFVFGETPLSPLSGLTEREGEEQGWLQNSTVLQRRNSCGSELQTFQYSSELRTHDLDVCKPENTSLRFLKEMCLHIYVWGSVIEGRFYGQSKF